MDADAFAAAHEAEWRRLDALVRRRRRLSGAEIDELVGLYQRTATHLSAVRSAGHDPVLVASLSSRVARARAAVTGAGTPSWAAAGRFALVSFPAMAYRARWWWLATAAGSLLVAFLIGWWVARSPAVQAALLPRASVRNLVYHQFRHYYSTYAPPAFAAQVWTNNAWVAALSLIFGILLGLPTLWLLASNAANLGVAAGLMISHGRGVLFFALILPHGMLELTAVFLAAATGLRLGWTVIDPGPRPRARALAEEGRASVTIALGLVVVLLVSGAIEAFVTPSPLPAWARILIGAAAEAAFLGYVIVAGRRAERAGLTPDIAEAPAAAPVSG
ncbi:MAG: stage II sporulation protein M [Actinobacteria bacterium]|nr:stage II sporulation protein M [Actinomycetota bacterium]MBO0785747.1 stage II sporulation protein M [Actinomycetota bacterium]